MKEPHLNDDFEKAPTTEAVLKYVRSQKEDAEKTLGGPGHGGNGGGGGHFHGGDGEEHEEQVHVDERWLIAYADKMTLLAGLFIMLFAMSTLDKTKFEKVKQSTEKSFGKPVDKKTTEMVDITVLTKSIEELEKNKRELEKAKESENTLKTKLVEIERQLEDRKKDKVQIEELQKRIVAQTAEIEKLTVPPPPTKVQEDKTPELQKIVKQQERRIEKLEGELKEAKEAATTSSFLAFVMSWSTRSHDLDLKVEDPEGKTFDFKHRKHGSHPGLFVLDTREGPGAEIWQADKILVGTYKFTFTFYSQHGNPEPCVISARLFSPQGGVEIPIIKLDGTAQRNHTAKIRIDKAGNATLLP